MKCPSCSHQDTKVIDSRLCNNGNSIRRRRECLDCSQRFTTYEYVEQTAVMVVKRDGRRQPFNRKKIISGIVKACEKRPISMDQIDEMVELIERSIQRKYDREIEAKDIGDMVMEKLIKFDEVAYVRFASVYRQFRDVGQFMNELKTMINREHLS